MSVSYWIFVKLTLLMKFNRIIQHVRQDFLFLHSDNHNAFKIILKISVIKILACKPSKRCGKLAIQNQNLMYLQKM